jgi:hypothetical protein
MPEGSQINVGLYEEKEDFCYVTTTSNPHTRQ